MKTNIKKYHPYLGEVTIVNSTINWLGMVMVRTSADDVYLVDPSHLTDIQVVSPTTREMGQRAPVSSKMLDCPKAV